MSSRRLAVPPSAEELVEGPGKADRRRDLRRLRRSLGPAQRHAEAAATAEALWQWLLAHQIRELASYLALADELDLDPLHRRWWTLGRPVWLPRVLGPGALAWHPVREPGQCRPGAYGIREPDPARVPAQPLPPGAALLVPGVGFTRDGHRLGQGGGFYDRVLPAHPGPAIGVGFSCQCCDHLPLDPHDRRCALVVLGGVIHQP